MKVKSPLSGKPSTTTPSSEFDTANKKYVDDNLLSHIDNLAIHLTSAQNSWLDAITATAAEVNHLSGVSSNIQSQLNNKLGLGGGTLTGSLTLSDAPTVALHASTKQYVDDGLALKAPLTGAGTSGTWPISITGNAANATNATSVVTPTFTGALSDYSLSDANTGSAAHGVVFGHLQSIATNKPTGTDHALMSMNYSDSWSVQMAGDWRTNNWYVRSLTNGTWSQWATIYTTNNLTKATTSSDGLMSSADKTKIDSIQNQLNFARGLNEGAADLDPNTTTSNVIITNHANSPVASGYYWHITTTFYTSITGTANRGQLAIQYNGGISAYVRSCFGGVWTAWTRIDNAGGGIMTSMIRTSNSYGDGTSLTAVIGSNSIQVMGDPTTSAFLSFHRAGAYAINLGIDTDNIFKLGGWSAGVTTFSCTPAGNFQPRLSLSLPNEYYIGNISGGTTIYFSNGQKARVILTGNVTLSFVFPGVGHYTLVLVQDGAGNKTVSYAVAPRFVGRATAPDINVAANSETILTLYWNGAVSYITGSKVGAA